MRGPHILARTLNRSPSVDGSTLACWTLLFDALLHSDALLRDATASRVVFGFNRPMVGPVERRVAATIERPLLTWRASARCSSLTALGDQFGVALDDDDRELLGQLPAVPCEFGEGEITEVTAAVFTACNGPDDASPVAVHADFVASRHLLQRHQPGCIGVAYGLVKTDVGGGVRHWLDALRDVGSDTMASDMGQVVGCTVVEGPPYRLAHREALQRSLLHYERMIFEVSAMYRRRAPA